MDCVCQLFLSPFLNIFIFLTSDIFLLMCPILDLKLFMGSVNIEGLCDVAF